jgi:hypothetical protein
VVAVQQHAAQYLDEFHAAQAAKDDEIKFAVGV